MIQYAVIAYKQESTCVLTNCKLTKVEDFYCLYAYQVTVYKKMYLKHSIPPKHTIFETKRYNISAKTTLQQQSPEKYSWNVTELNNSRLSGNGSPLTE